MPFLCLIFAGLCCSSEQWCYASWPSSISSKFLFRPFVLALSLCWFYAVILLVHDECWIWSLMKSLPIKSTGPGHCFTAENETKEMEPQQNTRDCKNNRRPHCQALVWVCYEIAATLVWKNAVIFIGLNLWRKIVLSVNFNGTNEQYWFCVILDEMG